MIPIETSVNQYEAGHVGEIDVWLENNRDQTYLGGWYGFADDLARRLEEDEYYGLSRYIQKVYDPNDVIAYLAGMEVGEKVTGRGIGSTMVDAFLGLAREQSVRTFFLHRSQGRRSSDEQLKGFYKRFGFKKVRCCAKDLWPVMKLEM